METESMAVRQLSKNVCLQLGQRCLAGRGAEAHWDLLLHAHSCHVVGEASDDLRGEGSAKTAHGEFSDMVSMARIVRCHQAGRCTAMLVQMSACVPR